MSYDFTLIKSNGADDLASLIDDIMAEPVGRVDEVKAAINRLFPSVAWDELTIPNERGESIIAWCGHHASPDFQLMTDAGGDVTMISMSRAERSDAELVASVLKLTLIDEQSMDIFNG